MNFFLRLFAVWLGLFALAFVNGGLREIVMIRIFGLSNHISHQLSCITGVIIWTAFIVMLWNYIDIVRLKQAVITGVIWFILTVLTETFFINMLLSGLDWKGIIQTYNIFKGELWILVLFYLGIVPVLLFKIKKVF